MIPDSELLEDADMLLTPIRPTPLAPATNGLQLLRFADEEIQVIHDADGEPLFRASHVCEAIRLTHPRRSCRRISVEFKGVTKVSSPGGQQNALFLREAGVWELLATARLHRDNPNAERMEAFRRWLFADVLPSIRKTGRYDTAVAAAPAPAPEVRLAPIMDEIEANIRLTKLLGLDANQALLAARNRIMRVYKFDIQAEFQLALPSPANEIQRTATEVAAVVSGRIGTTLSAIAINKRLDEAGWQVKQPSGKGWEPTTLGKVNGGLLMDVGKANVVGRPVQQTVWRGDAVLEFLSKTPVAQVA